MEIKKKKKKESTILVNRYGSEPTVTQRWDSSKVLHHLQSRPLKRFLNFFGVRQTINLFQSRALEALSARAT
jgi:hypothetical protein